MAEVAHEVKRRLRLIVETYYQVQDVRMRTDQRIQEYAEEAALAAVVGEMQVVALRNAGDHNKSYKKAIKDLKTGVGPEQMKFIEGYDVAVKGLESEKRHRKVNDLMREQETLLKTQAMNEIGDHPLWKEWLCKVRGIGPCLAGGIISWINIHKCPHASNLISYAGMGVVIEKYICLKCNLILDGNQIPSLEDRMKQGQPHEAARCPKCQNFFQVMGHGARREKKKVLGYNPNVKTLCWKIGESFVKQPAEKSGYRKIYDKFRTQIEARIAANNGFCGKVHYASKGKGGHGEEGDGEGGTEEGKKGKVIPCFDAHVFAMSKRATVKIFLSHIYKVWRGIEKLPVSTPFSFGMLGHDVSSMIEPIVDKEVEE